MIRSPVVFQFQQRTSYTEVFAMVEQRFICIDKQCFYRWNVDRTKKYNLIQRLMNLSNR